MNNKITYTPFISYVGDYSNDILLPESNYLQPIKLAQNVGSVTLPKFDLKDYIPEEIDGLPVADISYAFTELSVEEVMLPDCIVVAEYAFAWCNSLETINYPASLKFGDSFIGFSSVTDITVPDGVCYINQHFDCPKIKSIHIPASVIHICFKNFVKFKRLYRL